MFDEIAEYYDYFKLHRDYKLEAMTITELLRQYGGHAVQSVVELGCGTGSLLQELAMHNFEVSGIDSSVGMLEQARKKLGDNVSLLQADFESYSPDSRHDAAIWIDGAIGYVPDVQLPHTLANISRNILAQSGVIIIEPWYAPDTWKPDTNHVVTHTSDSGDVYVRLSHGNHDGSVVFHHLIANSTGVKHVVGRTQFWLHDNDQVCEMLSSEGLDVTQMPDREPFKRGLIVGYKT